MVAKLRSLQTDSFSRFTMPEFVTSTLPSQGRLAGIDFGTVRLGLAICDPGQRWTTPLETYQRHSRRADETFFARLARQEEICGWVVGLPIHCDGAESEKSREARQFGQWLGQTTRLPVAFFDERFTTAEARKLLNDTPLSGRKRKKQLDQMAAYLILTHYLDSESHRMSQNEALEG